MHSGDLVFQVARGRHWVAPYVTPTKDVLVGNFCVDCFHAQFGELAASQVQPYHCTLCSRPIQNQESVIYATYGYLPDEPAIRLEQRGDELHFIVCVDCWRDERFERVLHYYNLAKREWDTELDEITSELKVWRKAHGR